MKNLFLAIVLGLLTGAVTRGNPMDEGRAALEEGLPSVAIAKLAAINSSALDASQKEELTILMARALLATKASEAAIKLLVELPSPQSSEGRFWLAEGLADASPALERALAAAGVGPRLALL
jgi:thioredoxin-like negative regulator of GroEL